MYNVSRQYRHDKKLVKQTKDARMLMHECGWGKTCTFDELSTFVEKYPDRAVYVFADRGMSMGPLRQFVGVEYVLEKDAAGTPICGKALYLYYFADKEHFYYEKVPAAHAKDGKIGDAFCYGCQCVWWDRHGHECDEVKRIAARVSSKKDKPCIKCSLIHSDPKECRYFQCRWCPDFFLVTKKRGLVESDDQRVHRCPVMKPERKPEKYAFLKPGDKADGSKVGLWAWDCESRIDTDPLIVVRTRKFIAAKEVDGRWCKEQPGARICTWISQTMAAHVVNYIVAQNVFTGQVKEFSFDDDVEPMAGFVHFATNSENMGNNIFVAHNSSGYDSKLLLNHLHKNFKSEDICMIANGQKIQMLKVGAKNYCIKTKFHDSMLQLPGGLAKLANDFCPGLLKKGYFPHKFNRLENQQYVGALPPKEMFDIGFSAKGVRDVDTFNAWWEEENAKGLEWVFKKEIAEYCRNDVHVLATIMKIYEDIMMERWDMSPWFSTTGPSFVHEKSLISTWKLASEGLEELKESYPISYKERIVDIAYNEHWCVQKLHEYIPARQALRGGRTENKQMHVLLTDEEVANGVHMRYWDVCSMYPYQQLSGKPFPVGVPVITIYDRGMDLCHHPDCKNNATRLSCEHRTLRGDSDYLVEYVDVQPTVEEILQDESFFGIVCATLQPPKMLHPVLAVFDEEKKKCLFSCERLVKGYFDSPNFKYALKCGYKLERLHRLDKYKQAASLWRPMQMELYSLKMVNSGDEPSDFEGFCQEYGEKFGVEFEDIIRGTKGKWGFRSALKTVYKILNNCGWGKHAQRPNMPSNEVFGDQDMNKYYELMTNFNAGGKTFKNSFCAENHVQITYVDNERKVPPNIGNQYLPAAVFVTAYARLQLTMELHKLEATQVDGRPRVVMMDTDSIIAIYYPEDKYPGVYNIPEGKKVGDWEREDIDKKHGGIREYIGLGPKTYVLKAVDGTMSVPKSKGVRLGYATENIVSFEAYRGVVRDFLRDRWETVLQVPQTQFASTWERGIYTVEYWKKLGVNPKEFKGVCDEHGYIWPYGYNEAPDQVELGGVMTDESLFKF